MLAGKHIVLGVSGSIAAYKAVYVLRRLTELGATVSPVLTPAATRFVGALTFSALAGRRAVTDLWTQAEAGEIGHVELAHEADLLLYAPASADLLARLSEGRADEPLTAIALASRAPLLLAPAMEDHMWQHPATQAHVEALRGRGARFILPEAGALASGRSGQGRLAEPDLIVEMVVRALAPTDLVGKHVLVTAGPTREAFDPARYVSNASSGKMGYAIAHDAARRGARVTLVSGPTALTAPSGVELVHVETTLDMLSACERALLDADVLVMAAAPADFRPKHIAKDKLKKETTSETLTVELVRNPDILRTLDARGRGKLAVGFAAETTEIEAHAKEKLAGKNLDLIVANDITRAGAGFASDTNAVTLYFRDGRAMALPFGSKLEVAHGILDQVVALLA